MDPLARFSLAVSITGILILLFLANTLSPPLSKISELQNKKLGERITISGNLTTQKNYQTLTILILEKDQNEIEVIVSSPLNLTLGKTLLVTGTLEKYQNRLQIRASKIFEY